MCSNRLLVENDQVYTNLIGLRLTLIFELYSEVGVLDYFSPNDTIIW